jgi:hypothetical protein
LKNIATNGRSIIDDVANHFQFSCLRMIGSSSGICFWCFSRISCVAPFLFL